MRACACVTASRLCVRTVLCSSAFLLVPSPPSTNSAVDRSALFAGFAGTIDGSDFFVPFIIGYGCRATCKTDPRIASLKMLPDNIPVVSGAEPPNQFGGGYGREDQHARKARDYISAGRALSSGRPAREGADP